MLRSSISSPALQSFISNSTMSSSRFSARGRSRWHRGYCYRPPWDGRDGGDHSFVSGDSHLNTVRDANYWYRQGQGGNYSIPRGSPGQDFPPHPQLQFRPSSHPQSRTNPHPQFRPHPQFHPRPQSQRPDDYRNWVYAVPQPPPQCERFIVLSYNILADYLARDHRSKLYFHIPHYVLDWEWRKKRLFLEFGLWSPDIMCLQEVDRFHDLEEELTIRGYAGIWKMRTGNAVDGCAIFWRTNRFQLRHEENIEFNKFGLRDNVAQICVLEPRNQNPTENPSTSSPASSDQSRRVSQIVICNIHVLYNPKRGEMKLGQVRLLLDRAYAVSRIWNDAPVIVCGDFNSTPESPLYKFISEQKLSLSGLARDQISGQYAASVYAPRPYVASGLYRPQHSIGNHTEAKDVDQGEIDEVGTVNGCSSDDTSSSSKLVDQSQKKDEGCEVQNEIPVNVGNFRKQNEPCSGEFLLEHGGHRCTIQEVDSIQSELNGCHSQPNEGVSNELISHGLDSTTDLGLCQELKDSLCGEMNISKSNSVTSVERTTHEGSTGHDILKDNMDLNQAPPIEDSQSDMSPEKTLFDEGLLDGKPLNDSGTSISLVDLSAGTEHGNAEVSILESMDLSPAPATREKGGVDISWQNICRMNQLNSSTLDNEVDRKMVGNLHSDEDNGNGEAAKILPGTEENTTLDIVDHNLCINAKSEESKKFSEKPVFTGGSCREQLEDHSCSRQGGSMINESCSPEESSDPSFFEELIGTEDARDTQLYDENNFSFSPVHTSGNAETSGDTSDPTLHNPKLDPATARIQNDFSHPVDFPATNIEYSYNPYLWTPMEIELASGNAECGLVEHRLKLRSAYADVEDYTGTKGSSREPEITSYHRLFMGTVDYIWYSEGLQTVKVLDTIPKHVLQRTLGFPTRKWGSDHLALACELALTKGVETTK